MASVPRDGDALFSATSTGDPGVAMRFIVKPRFSNIVANASAMRLMSALFDAMLGIETSCSNSPSTCRSWAARHARTRITSLDGAALRVVQVAIMKTMRER